MSLEEIGNLGEFISAIGVVISLIYLAYQVRDNSKFVKENSEFLRATHDVSSNDGVGLFRKNYFDHPELLEIERRGNLCEELNYSESVQYQLLVAGNFESHFTYFLQHRRGLTSDEVWHYWSRFFDDYCQHKGVQRWWRKSADRFPEEFRDYISGKLEQAREP